MNKKEQEIDIQKKKEQEISEQNAPSAEGSELENNEEKSDSANEAEEEDELAKAKEEIAKLKDQYLRKVAEFENYRKRTTQEKLELVRNGGQRVIEELLPVLDDFDRAWQNIDKTDDISTLKEGVSLIMKKLNDTLAAQGLKVIETEGQTFDTQFHEGIALVPVEDDSMKGKVVDCVSKGYTLNDKVIRYAKVAVGQ